jgi:arylformamidase
MSQQERDLGLNNGVAVPGSADIVAGWEQRSAEMRKRYPDHLDLRYGPRERNRIDFLKARDGADAAVHPRRLLADAPKEDFSRFAEGRWRMASMSR